MTRAARKPHKLITDRWLYTSDGIKCPASVSAQELTLPGANRQPPGERPPWFRLVVLEACSNISPGADSKKLWASFEAFLSRPPVTDLVRPIVNGRPGLQWKQWSTNRTGDIDAVLTPATEDDAIASARLELPDGASRFGRDPRCATLILHFEPTRNPSPPLPAVPDIWEERIAKALALPRALSELLSGELGLATSGDAPAQIAIRLEARKDLTEMIHITGMTQLPGRPNGIQAIGYFIASLEGATAGDAAEQMITHVLRYALRIQH